MSFFIDNVEIGSAAPAYIIAEIGQAHEGSLGMAHAYVDAVAKAGANAIKFQTHFADEESTSDEPFRVKFSKQDATRFDYWRRMEFTDDQWFGLAEHCRSLGLTFMSSPFSTKAMALLEKIGVPAWKLGSGETLSKALVDRMINSKLPIIASTGMNNWTEIDDLVSILNDNKCDYCLMQCTSEYPTSFERVGINVLDEFALRYQCVVGLSDHSGSIYPSLLSMSRGCNIIELHVTFNKGMFGPDVSSSVTLDELELVIEARDAFFKMMNSNVDKNAASERLGSVREMFTKSLSLRQDGRAGDELRLSDLTLKKPGTGISKENLNDLVGRRLAKDVPSTRLLRWDDVI